MRHSELTQQRNGGLRVATVEQRLNRHLQE
jgi:hypothetical protein